MIKQITSVVVSYLEHYPSTDIMPLVNWAIDQYEKQHSGDIMNEVELLYDSRYLDHVVKDLDDRHELRKANRRKHNKIMKSKVPYWKRRKQ